MPFPLFDAHVHYDQRDWSAFSPQQVLDILDRAGVHRALVSSIHDDGTLQLLERAPKRIIPFLSPYRTRRDIKTWHSDSATQSYVEERLKRGIYRGIGELDLAPKFVEAPVVRRFAEIAAKDNLFLHADVNSVTLRKLLTLYPRTKIIWAHAGMSVSPATIGSYMDQSPNLWAELAQRSDVAPSGNLDPAWRSLFLKHRIRFMIASASNPRRTIPKFFSFVAHPEKYLKVASDPWTAWVESRWETLVDGMPAIRAWLAQLPAEVADQIAYRNAEQLFGTLAD
jgi:hypothetical protein